MLPNDDNGLLPASNAEGKARPALRIASLNILHGGGPRVRHIADWLLAQNADAILIQEWRHNPPGQRLSDTLKVHRYRVDAAV